MTPPFMTIDPERVFLYTGGKQLGPFQAEAAESFWKKKGCPEETWFWSPGMQDWKPIGDLVPKPTPEKKSLRVLAVDDDPIMLEIVKLTLQNDGLAYKTAGDLVPATRLLESEGLDSFGCVVTDYNMPGGTGLDLVRWIKQRDESLQVLLLTAKDDKQLVKAGLRAGIYDFLEKPLVPDSFLRSLNGAIDQTQKRREEREALMEMVKIKLSGQGHLAEEVIQTLAARESHSGSLILKLDSIVKYSRKLEDSSPVNAGIQGDLGELNLIDITQLLSQAGKSGVLIINPKSRKSEHPEGQVFFKNGRFYHVSTGEKRGIDALRELMSIKDGTFKFQYGTMTDTESIKGDPIALMLMISTELDQRC